METENGLVRPLNRIRTGLLPADIQRELTPLQGAGLAFATRQLKVDGVKVQTFQVGASSSGMMVVGGLGRSLGANWGAFGGLGTVNQNTINQFRTDIQLRLEDPGNGEKTFLQTSLPFEITLSIEPGETLTLYFARGGLAAPKVQGDFRLNDWTPFVAKNMSTGQLIPMAPLPSLAAQKIGGVGCGIALLIMGGLGLIAGLSSSGSAGGASQVFPMLMACTLFFLLPGAFLSWLRPSSKRNQWQRDFEAAKRFAETCPL